jgi:hypothetical protein
MAGSGKGRVGRTEREGGGREIDKGELKVESGRRGEEVA